MHSTRDTYLNNQPTHHAKQIPNHYVITQRVSFAHHFSQPSLKISCIKTVKDQLTFRRSIHGNVLQTANVSRTTFDACVTTYLGLGEFPQSYRTQVIWYMEGIVHKSHIGLYGILMQCILRQYR